MTILQQQLLLAYLDYQPGPFDGVDGPKTQAALQAFQNDYGCGAEGLIGAIAGTVPKRRIVASDFWANIRYVPKVEWRCPCGRCGGFPVEPQEGIARFLDDLRIHFGKPVDISSGVRCRDHNAELPGSVSNSRHLSGKAVDFRVRGQSATITKMYCDKMVAAGVLRYCYCIDGEFVHADIL